MTDLVGRVALVTGSSSGIGRASALALAAKGAAVLCADLQKSAKPGGFETDADVDTDQVIVRRGGKAAFVVCNVSQAEQVERAVAAAVANFGRLDIMVNNAGTFTGLSSIVDQSEADYDLTMAVNAKGVWLGCKYALRQMFAQDPLPGGLRGRIVNVASVGGMSGLQGEPAYCASKGAVLALTRQLAVDYGRQHVNVNAVMPGMILTAMSRDPMSDPAIREHLSQFNHFPRFGSSEDIGAAVAFLASDEAAFINGASMPVDGAFLAF